MTSPTTETDAASFRRLVTEAADSLGELVADHLKLARVELAADVRTYAGATGEVVVAVLLLMVGYLLASVAAAFALGRFTGIPVAFLLVSAFHLLTGGLCARAASGRARRMKVLRETVVEAHQSVRALAQPSERRAS